MRFPLKSEFESHFSRIAAVSLPTVRDMAKRHAQPFKDLQVLNLKVSVNTASFNLPLKSALMTAAETGACAVEIDARQQLNAQELSRTGVRQILKWLSDHRLKVACLRFQPRHALADNQNLQQRIDAIKSTLKTAYQLGCSTVCCDIGPIPQPESDQANQLRDVLLDIANAAHREGAFLAARTGRAAPQQLADLIQELPHGTLLVDMDPGNLVIHEHEVETALKRLSSSAVHLHARDAVRDFASRQTVEVELGRGSVDWPAVFAHLEQEQFQGYTTVGRVGSPDPLLEATMAVQYLQNLFAL